MLGDYYTYSYIGKSDEIFPFDQDAFFVTEDHRNITTSEDHILSKMVNNRTILHGDIGEMPSLEKNLSVESGRKLIADQEV